MHGQMKTVQKTYKFSPINLLFTKKVFNWTTSANRTTNVRAGRASRGAL